MHQFGSTSSLKKSKPYCKGFCKEKNVIEFKKIKIKEQNSVPAIQQLGEEGPEVKELLTPPGTAEAINTRATASLWLQTKFTSLNADMR